MRLTPASTTTGLPVDVLLLCGIFGNISDAGIQTTIGAAPSLVVGGGVVIWTRGGFEPDLRPRVRGWFTEAGHEEIAFDGDPETFGVGVKRVARHRGVGPLPPRLFTFLR